MSIAIQIWLSNILFHLFVIFSFPLSFLQFWHVHIVHYLDKAVLKPRVSHAFAITYLYNHCNISPTPMVIHESMWIQWLFPKLNQTVNDPKRTFDSTSVEVTCVTLPKDHFIQVPWKYIKVCGYSDPFFFKNLKGHWPLDDLWPPSLLRSHVWLYPRITDVQVPWNTSKYVDAVTLFAKNLNQRSLTPRWPLTPHLLRSQVWLYPRIIVSKSHGNTSMYVDTVINFAKYHIHNIQYIYYIQNEWSHSVFLNSVQMRQKRNIN